MRPKFSLNNSFYMWSFIQDWKGGAAMATFFAFIPLLHLVVFAQASKVDVSGWTFSNLNGLYSRVRVFIENLGRSSAQTSSLGGGTISSNDFSITKVSAERARKTPDLVFELPLNYLNRLDHYKYCIPEKSKLKKTQKTSQSSSSSQACKLKWFSEVSSNKEAEKGTISYLLGLSTKFLEAQHAANMVLIYDKNTNFLEGNQNPLQKMQSIASECKIVTNTSSEILKELFLSATKSVKKCLLSPSDIEVRLRVRLFSQENGKITKDRLSQGFISGALKYGIFDYFSTNALSIPINGGTNNKKNLSFRVDWPLIYVLSPTGASACSFDQIHKAVTEQSLSIQKLENCLY